MRYLKRFNELVDNELPKVLELLKRRGFVRQRGNSYEKGFVVVDIVENNGVLDKIEVSHKINQSDFSRRDDKEYTSFGSKKYTIDSNFSNELNDTLNNFLRL